MQKELKEIGRSRGLLLSMFALPAPMVVVAVGLVTLMQRMGTGELEQLMAYYKVPVVGDAHVAMVSFWVRECVGLFLVMPLFIPVLISAQSVAGEKERRTIEPLLASPLTATEIVLAKSLAAVLPAMFVTFVSFGIFAVAVDVVTFPTVHRLLVPNVSWAFALIVLAPLLSFLGNTITVLVSSRVNDSRLAQQIAALIVIPFLGLTTVQFTGILVLGPLFYAALGLGVAVVDVTLLVIAVTLFDRQWILSRWS